MKIMIFHFRRSINDHESQDLANLLFVFTRGLPIPNFKWTLEPSGVFSRKSLLARLVSESNPPISSFFSMIWKNPKKIRFFAWLVSLGRLNTDFIQRSSSMVVCPNDSGVWNVMCAKRSTEDLVHVIRSCHFALTLWRKFLNTIGVNVPPGGCKGTEEVLVNSSFSKKDILFGTGRQNSSLHCEIYGLRERREPFSVQKEPWEEI